MDNILSYSSSKDSLYLTNSNQVQCHTKFNFKTKEIKGLLHFEENPYDQSKRYAVTNSAIIVFKKTLAPLSDPLKLPCKAKQPVRLVYKYTLDQQPPVNPIFLLKDKVFLSIDNLNKPISLQFTPKIAFTSLKENSILCLMDEKNQTSIDCRTGKIAGKDDFAEHFENWFAFQGEDLFLTFNKGKFVLSSESDKKLKFPLQNAVFLHKTVILFEIKPTKVEIYLLRDEKCVKKTVPVNFEKVKVEFAPCFQFMKKKKDEENVVLRLVSSKFVKTYILDFEEEEVEESESYSLVREQKVLKKSEADQTMIVSEIKEEVESPVKKLKVNSKAEEAKIKAELEKTVREQFRLIGSTPISQFRKQVSSKIDKILHKTEMRFEEKMMRIHETQRKRSKELLCNLQLVEEMYAALVKGK